MYAESTIYIIQSRLANHLIFETVKINWPSVSIPVGQPHLQSVPSGLICFQLRTEIVECCSQSCLLGVLGFGLGFEYVLFLAAAKGLEQPNIIVGCSQKKRMCSILRYYWYTQVERKLHIPHLPSRPRGRTADVPNSFQDLLPSKLLVGLGQEALVFLNMQNSEHKTGNIANYPVSSTRVFLAHHAQAKGHRSPFWFGHICYE